MSSIVNKVKEVLHSDKDKTHTEGSHATHTTHGSSAAEPRTHTTHDTTTGLGGTHREGNLGGSDNYTHGTGDNRGASGPASRTDGPHSSNLMNKVDPRVDSDRDHSRNMGMNPQGTATTGTQQHHPHSATGTGAGVGAMGTSGFDTHGTHTTTGVTGTAGPHSSNLMNKADPRVDSDRDGSRNMGMNPQGTTTTATTGIGGTHTGFQETGANRGFGGPATRTDGPHETNLMNKADPRVDSDRDHSRNVGMNPQGSATTGTHGGLGGSSGAFGATGGTHDTTTRTTGGFGPGPAANTAGPHQSDLLNKADPRVDSDLDGSKTMGGNKTYAQQP